VESGFDSDGGLLAIAFLGAATQFSASVLDALAGAGVAIEHVWRSGPAQPVSRDEGARGLFALAQPDPLSDVCRRRNLPAPERIETASALRAVFANNSPDLGLCACFGMRLPGAVLDRFQHGAINFHPSILPAYRGPAPLHWQLRDGVEQTGVSIHRMVPQLDAGAVLGCVTMPVTAGASLSQLEAALGERGGTWLGRRLLQCGAGGLGAGTVQDETAKSYQSWPRPCDYQVSPLWSAERAYRFMRAVRHAGEHFPIQILGERFELEMAVDFCAGAKLDARYTLEARSISIQMNPGVLQARLAR
jgi:methionyl-tRNA formyltransferase